MAHSLLIFINNLAERIHKTKCQNEDDNKICETCGNKYKNLENIISQQKTNVNLVKKYVKIKIFVTL